MKIIGFFIIFFSCSAYGFLKSLNYIKMLEETRAFELFLKHIRDEISLHQTRQSEIFAKFENKSLEKNGFMSVLRSEKICNDKSLFYNALLKHQKSLKVNRDVMNILFDFSSDFGRLPLKEQCEKCALAISALEDAYKTQKADTDAKVKISRYVGVMCGLAIILLLM